ncbi:cell division protein ZipA [Thalassotalea insulae]|uniref:Cell division protein ZipA n=1 Tax=Thalassotalea insulae TaxID=2056778 RepID=A0ABQ6GP03_9GAMM|nr:cell division protein ZipA [Thalassotalea insulae]GLX76899.1 cell division protein ZipA [Thalassotalea insulae]
MEDNFRNALIIISAIVIAAIFVHGFWTIRKNKNPYKLKTKNEKVDLEPRGYDSSGFDQDGVGQIRVIGANSLNEDEIPSQPAPAPEYDEEPLPVDLEKPCAEHPALEPSLGDLSDIKEQPPEDRTPPPAQTSELAPSEMQEQELPVEQIEESEPVYQQPVTKPKPARKKVSHKRVTEKLKRNQMEINFGDEAGQSPSMTATDEPKAEQSEKSDVEPEVIVVSVVMPEGQQISGAALLPTLLTLGLRYGDMNIFHRHQDNAGNGKVTFSLANMMNPGTFDLDAMESFTTQGITLFMTLPNAGDPFEVFEHMMNAAKQLSMEFHAQLLDDKRSVMTKQTEQHYIGKIREFERRSRIASA